MSCTVSIDINGSTEQLSALPPSIFYNLRRGGITAVKALLRCTDDDLLDIDNIGDLSIKRIDKVLADYGLVRGPFHRIAFLELPSEMHHRFSMLYRHVEYLRRRHQRGETFNLPPDKLTLLGQSIAAFDAHECTCFQAG